MHKNVKIKAGFRQAAAHRIAISSQLAVSELQLSAVTPLWSFYRATSLESGIEVNCLRSTAVGKAARLSIDWLDAACRWSSLCGKWHLRSCTKVTIKAAICGERQASRKAALHKPENCSTYRLTFIPQIYKEDPRTLIPPWHDNGAVSCGLNWGVFLGLCQPHTKTKATQSIFAHVYLHAQIQ